MIVEGQGMGLWTRVRLPPIPSLKMLGTILFIGIVHFMNLLNLLFQTVSNHNKCGQDCGQDCGQINVKTIGI